MQWSLSSTVVGCLIESVAFGQAAQQNITTSADAANIGGEFRAEWTHDDHGLDKANGYDPEATDSLSVQTAKIILSGKINPRTEVKFRFNLLDPKDGNPLDYGYGTHNLNETTFFSVGKMKLLQGGWDNIDNSYRDHAKSIASENFPFDKNVAMLAFGAKVAGKITLQVFNDVVNDGTKNTTSWNKTEHPTWALGWQGKFGDIQPILVFGSYDNSKSRWIDAGVKGDLMGAKFAFDVRQETRSVKGSDADGKAKSLDNVATAATLKLAYAIEDAATPWVYYSIYDMKQGDDEESGSDDLDSNATSAKFDDNGTVVGFGADLDVLGKGWTPYLAMVMKLGDFSLPADANKTASKTKTTLHLGVLGAI